jgi:uncharacterized protein YggE
MVEEERVMSREMDRRVGRRRIAGGLLAAALGLIVMSPVAAASQGGYADGPGSGQKEIAQGIAVRGDGEAEAPADSALMQFIARVDPNQAEANANAAFAEGSTKPSDVSDEQMQSLVAAAQSKGIDDKSVDYFVVPNNTFTSAFGPGVGVLVVQLDKAELKHRVKIADAVTDAAEQNGLIFDQVGAIYIVDDCAALDSAALAEAAESAERQATLMAQAMGLTLGELIGVEKQPTYSGYGGQSTDACTEDPTMQTAKEIYFPPFDREHEAVREVYESLLVTYAIG